MKPFLVIIYLFCLTALQAQPNEWKALYGQWKVEKRMILDSTVFSGSAEGRKVAEQENKECLTGEFTFTEIGITVDKEVCDFENCNTNKDDIQLKQYLLSKAKLYIYDFPGDEMEEDEVVGPAFLKLIGLPNAKSLSAIELDCDNAEMDKLRVCLINANHVALFYDDNLLLLRKVGI